jgi:hypothetical protein
VLAALASGANEAEASAVLRVNRQVRAPTVALIVGSAHADVAVGRGTEEGAAEEGAKKRHTVLRVGR